jgi:hypothetical protein
MIITYNDKNFPGIREKWRFSMKGLAFIAERRIIYEL